jgi:hypothetical protein
MDKGGQEPMMMIMVRRRSRSRRRRRPENSLMYTIFIYFLL